MRWCRFVVTKEDRKRSRNRSIEHRIVVATTGLVFVVLIALGVASGFLQARRLTSRVEAELRTRAVASLGQLESRLEYLRETVRSFSNSSIATNSLTDAAGRGGYLPAAIRDFAQAPEVVSVTVFDFAGRAMESTDSAPSLDGVDLQPALTHGDFVVRPGQRPGTALMIAPILYYGTPQGGVIVAYDLTPVLEAANSDEQHGFVLSLADGWSGARGARVADPISTIQNADITLPLLHSLGARLETQSSREQVMSPVRSALLELALLGFFALFVSFFVARALGKRLAAPIQQLTRRVTLDQHPYLPMRSTNELEILASRLDAQHASLRAANAQLEERVRARTEELEHQADQLKRSNWDLEQFAYISTHDLQEPLRMMSSYCEIISQRCEGVLDEKSLRQFGYVTDGAKRMQSLLDGLLQYSRVNSASKEHVAVDCADIVTEVRQDLELAIQESGALVEVGELPHVVGDSVQIRQLFQNLIANGIKFSNQETPRVVITATQSGQEEYTFCVKDNGIGISSDHTGKIFQIFQRLHGRDEYDGSGVGLTIVKRVVERHNGRVWVESDLGEGAAFKFTLAKAS